MVKYCSNCGHELIPDTFFCGNCGTKIHLMEENNSNTPEKTINMQIQEEVPLKNENLQPQNSQENQTEVTVEHFNCPICEKEMDISQEDGILLGGIYYSCPDCSLKFRQFDENYSLYESPENTRFNKRYAFEMHPKEEWLRIGKCELSDNEMEKIKRYESLGYSHYNCPYCNKPFHKYLKKSYFTKLLLYQCDDCRLTFRKVGNGYRFMNSALLFIPLWNFYHQTMLKQQWENALQLTIEKDGTLLNKEQLHNILEKHSNQYDYDVNIFMKNLESSNPQLPQINEQTMNLMPNERVLYKLESLQLLRGIVSNDNDEDRFNKLIPINIGTLVITDNRIYFEEFPNELNVQYNQIKSMEFLQRSLILNTTLTDESFVLFNFDSNEIVFNIGGRPYEIDFTPQMLYNLIKGQVLKR